MKSLSPLNKRRLDNFIKNKRGLYSFWIFFVLFIGLVFDIFPDFFIQGCKFGIPEFKKTFQFF